MFQQIIDALKNPFEKLDNGEILIHSDYRVDNTNKPVNFKPVIARNVVQQDILRKVDFVDFVNEYKQNGTKIFYDQHTVTAIFNYTQKDDADYGDSKCCMPIEHTTEFIKFTQNIGNKLGQKELIRFLKTVEPYITKLDGKQADDMDIIEIAESLQATKNINSVQRNTQQAFVLDVEVKAGNSSFEIPRKISFELPVFKNNIQLKAEFEAELFLEGGDGGFSAELVCYKYDEILEDTLRQLVKEVEDGCEGVDAFMKP